MGKKDATGKSRSFDLRQLSYFCAVARTGSFAHAAQELGIAQPSLSEQINKLEQALGVTLFERFNRRIEITAPGAMLLPRARSLIEEAAAVPRTSRRIAKVSGGRCEWERFRRSCRISSLRFCTDS